MNFARNKTLYIGIHFSRYITSLTSIDEMLLRDATFEPTQPRINVNISISYLAM